MFDVFSTPIGVHLPLNIFGPANSAAGRVNKGEMARGLEIERLYDEHAQSLYAFLLNLTPRLLQGVYCQT